ncbi:MAG: glycosyltransferase family 4 protein [Microbacterium sp.]
MTRVDVFLQYYRPHVSGLTNMAAVLAEYAAAEGYEMHVHCVSQTGAPYETVLDGVTVHAYKKSFSLRRAVFSIQLLRAMWRMRRRGGIAHVHMPYPESFVIAALFRRGWSIVSTYQCDAPTGSTVDNLIARALDWSHRLLITSSTITVTSSEDYAEASRLRDTIAAHGPAVVPVTGLDRQGGSPVYRIEGKRLIGFMGRPTYEKGINVLLDAIEAMPHEDVALLFAGPSAGLTEGLGYDTDKMKRLQDAGRIHSVGFLEEEQIKDFYASLDLYVHPSINSFDAFGIVQLEAMSAGIPVVASDIPGVRTAVWATGFGEITKAGNSADLLRGLLAGLEKTYDFAHAREVLETVYLPPVPQRQYADLYRQIAAP